MLSTAVVELFSEVNKPLIRKISSSSPADLSVPNSLAVLSSESCEALAFFFDFVTGGGIGRLLRPDIVHFRSACRGTEIFLRELTLLNTLSSNPKSSRSVDLAFSHKLLFYLH